MRNTAPPYNVDTIPHTFLFIEAINIKACSFIAKAILTNFQS